MLFSSSCRRDLMMAQREYRHANAPLVDVAGSAVLDWLGIIEKPVRMPTPFTCY